MGKAAVTDDIILTRALKEELLARARASPLEEICGFVAGQDGRLSCCYPVANVATDKRCRFLMDARGQFAAMRDIEARGEGLLGIYHSHVDTAAYPSATDLEWHAYPDTLYLIISPTQSANARVRAFWIRHERIHELELKIV